MGLFIFLTNGVDVRDYCAIITVLPMWEVYLKENAMAVDKADVKTQGLSLPEGDKNMIRTVFATHLATIERAQKKHGVGTPLYEAYAYEYRAFSEFRDRLCS